jgi:hypothetical protein
LADLLNDEQLLTFTDTSGLEYADKLSEPISTDSTEARQLLAQHGDVFRQHLVIAKLLEEQADNLEDPSADKAYGKVNERGYKTALRHTIDDLRDGQFLPGGNRYEDSAE